MNNKNIIITASNSQYYYSLLTLISSVHNFGINYVDNIVVYDLGLTNDEKIKLSSMEKVIVYEFSEDEKNLHPEFMVGKTHVYKCYCLKHASIYGNNIIWIDSGSCFINDFEVIFKKINSDDIFMVVDIHLNSNHTHSNCRRIMEVTESELNDKQLSSGLIGYKVDGRYQQLINDSVKYSLTPNCCDGDYEDHRHDQSILSILASRYNCPKHDIDIYGYWTSIDRNYHRAMEIGSIVFAHRRGYEERSNIRYKLTDLVSVNIINNTEKYIIKLIDENLVGQDGLSRYISPEVKWGRDVSNPNYEIGLFTDGMCFKQPIDDEKLNFAWLIEPPIINGENYSKIVSISEKFKYVFSYNKKLESKINNFVFIPHGGTWLRNDDFGIHNKTKNISLIYSDKTWNSGHRLRHSIVNQLKEKTDLIDYYGSGSNNPIEFKIDGLKDYRYSIVLENSMEDDYFTEKIIDCFLSGVIPIYWGTKNIGNYFDTDGIITFKSSNEWGFDITELLEILPKLTEEYYQSKIDSVRNNFNLGMKYIHPEHHIMEHINKHLNNVTHEIID